MLMTIFINGKCLVKEVLYYTMGKGLNTSYNFKPNDKYVNQSWKRQELNCILPYL